MSWNVAGVIVLAVLAVTASSVALVGFGLDSFIEVGASTVVLWELSGTGETRQRVALKLIGRSWPVGWWNQTAGVGAAAAKGSPATR